MSNQVAGGTILENASQGRRRLLVLRMYLCLAATVGIFAVAGEHWWIILAIVPLVYAFALYGKAIRPIADDLTEREDSELDERELMVRNRAYYHAYRILGILFALSLAYVLLATVFSDGANLPVPGTLSDFALLILLLSHLLTSLPASVVAWTAPETQLDA